MDCRQQGWGTGNLPKCKYLENRYTEMNIDLLNNERIVSLTMLAQNGAFLGFHMATEDGYGNAKSSLAGFLGGGNFITYAHNSDTTFQVRKVLSILGRLCLSGTVTQLVTQLLSLISCCTMDSTYVVSHLFAVHARFCRVWHDLWLRCSIWKLDRRIWIRFPTTGRFSISLPEAGMYVNTHVMLMEGLQDFLTSTIWLCTAELHFQSLYSMFSHLPPLFTGITTVLRSGICFLLNPIYLSKTPSDLT